ncbi:hypothetical protein ACEPAF_2861 [Sanghuangporus sanghuang]
MRDEGSEDEIDSERTAGKEQKQKIFKMCAGASSYIYTRLRHKRCEVKVRIEDDVYRVLREDSVTNPVIIKNRTLRHSRTRWICQTRELTNGEGMEPKSGVHAAAERGIPPRTMLLGIATHSYIVLSSDSRLSRDTALIKSQRSLDSKSDLPRGSALPDRSKNPRCRLSPSISCLFHHEASAKIRIALFEFATGISAPKSPSHRAQIPATWSRGWGVSRFGCEEGTESTEEQ